MLRKVLIRNIPKAFLWSSVFVLLFTSMVDSGVDAAGLNIYAMYFLIGIILLVVLLKLKTNPILIWNFPIVSGIYFVTELFNVVYYDFFPVTIFFPIYCTTFIVNLFSSLIVIQKHSVRFDMIESKAVVVVFFTLLSIGIGYWMQGLTYDGLI